MMEESERTYEIALDASGIDQALGDLEERASRFGSILNGALKSAIVDGRDLEAVMTRIGDRLAAIALDAGLKPLEGLVGRAAGGLGEAIVGAVVPFAEGGVVSAPSYFPMGGEIGLLGEAGPEAILPLTRGPDGRLGVAGGSGGGGRPQIVFNVTSPDVTSFSKSEAQVTAMLARAVGRGMRGL